MSMRSSLLEEEVSPYQDTTTSILLDDGVDEYSHLHRQYVNEEEYTYFQTLQSEVVRTKKGEVTVAIQGDRSKRGTALLTLHDIGQNHIKCFQSYFCFHQTKPLLKHFTVYHINFPGQEDDAPDLPEDYVYPTMEEMADVVLDVVNHFGIKKSICFGVGAGANVFLRLALKVPQLTECLVLVNPSCSTATWSDWGYEKMCSRYLRTQGMTTFCQDYLVYHYFGKVDENTNLDLVGLVRDQLHRTKSPKNLGLFMDSYSRRTAVKLVRPVVGQNNSDTVKSGVLILTGENSPAVDETVNVNSKLDPLHTSWIKIPVASSMVLEEQPTGVTNALVLFLKGYNYVMKVQPPPLPHVAISEIQGPAAIC